MNKLHKTVRLHDWLYNEAMETAKNTGESFTTVVERSLKKYLMENDPISKMIFKADCQLEFIIEYINQIKEHPDKYFSKKKQLTLDGLLQVQKQIRSTPHYIDLVTPPDFPDDEDQ